MSLEVALRHGFPGFTLDAAFEAPAGVTALFGPSGSGKTTVVNAVAGLLRPDAGRVAVDGAPLFDIARRQWTPPHRRRIGYVFQDGRLFPHLSVRRNLAYGRWFAGGARDAAETDRVGELLGLGALLDRRPGALSGGEKQRVAIGRALLSKPRLLLMDEPLAALDDALKAEILPYLERLRDEVSVPILYVSHSIAEVARIATTAVILREGRVMRSGPAAEALGDPALSPALGVRGAGAVLTARVVAHHADGLTELALEGERLLLPRIRAVVGGAVRVRLSAQDVILATRRPAEISALNILEGKVREIRPGTGPGAMVVVEIGAQTLLARITRRSLDAMALSPGTRCFAITKSVAVAPEDIGTAAT